MSEEMTDKQIIIDGVDVNALYSDQIACMNRYEVARLFIKTVELLVTKEQECEELKEELKNTKGLVTVGNRQITQSLEKVEDLKNELHSKVEFIQEQRNVIDEYSKEIEMYKKCQGSRASKREEKLKQTLTEIKEIAEANKKYIYVLPNYSVAGDSLEFSFEFTKQILQKISEVE